MLSAWKSTRRKWQKKGKTDHVAPELKTLQWLPSIVEIKSKLPASLLFLEHITVDPWPMQESEALTLQVPLTPCAVEDPHTTFDSNKT